MTNWGFDGLTEGDPGVGAIVWSRSVPVILAVYNRQLFEGDGGGAEIVAFPPEDVVGFTPFTLGAAIAFEKARGRRPRQSAEYRFPDGKFTHSVVDVIDRDYYFMSIDPAGTEEVAAIGFKLPETPEQIKARAWDDSHNAASS